MATTGEPLAGAIHGYRGRRQPADYGPLYRAETYPAPRTLLDFSRSGSISRPLLALTLLAAVLLAPSMWRSLLWQVQGVGDEHATVYHWIAGFEHTVILLVAGVLASTKRPGWQTLGIITGVVFLYLGLVALSVPDQAGSWGIIGGILGLVGGAGYIGAHCSRRAERCR
jgi:hypothetical protein